MSERPKNDPEELSGDFVEGNGLPQELANETGEEVDLLTRIEQAMLEEQKQDLLEDPEATKHLIELDDEKLGRHLNERERVFLESYGRPGYHFIPEDGKAASFAQLKAFFRKVPISPLLFQENIVSNVYHTKFVTKPNTEKRMKERQSRFDLLRRLFASLRPIYNKKRHELKKDRIRRMFVISIDEARGSILVTRKPGERRINSVYPDVYSAKRSLDHILNTYSGRYSPKEFEEMGELKAIRKLQNGTQFLIEFIQKWKTTTGEERDKSSQLITDARDLLQTCQNAYKVLATRDYDSATDFVDSRGQVNPGATAAKLVKAYNELKKRVEEIVSIKGVIEDDKKILEAFLNQFDQICFNAMREIGNFLETPYFEKYEQKTGQHSRIRYEAKKVNVDLFGGVDEDDQAKNGLMDRFQWMSKDARMPAPFQQYGTAVVSNFTVTEGINEYIHNNIDNLLPGQLKQLHNTLTEYAIRGHIVLRYQFIQRRYNAILSEILEDPYKIKPQQVQSKIDKLLVRFRPHQYKLPFDLRDDLSIEVPEFDSVYDHLREVSQKVRDWIVARDAVKDELNLLTNRVEDPYAESADEESIESIQVLEDRLTNLEIEFINELYELISGFDFMVPLRALTVKDPKIIVDEITSSV